MRGKLTTRYTPIYRKLTFFFATAESTDRKPSNTILAFDHLI
jgi:hypothetical protein